MVVTVCTLRAVGVSGLEQDRGNEVDVCIYVPERSIILYTRAAFTWGMAVHHRLQTFCFQWCKLRQETWARVQRAQNAGLVSLVEGN